MGTTFVELNERGFWVQDGLLELWLRLLALHIREPAGVEAPAPETAIRDQLLLASRGYFTGCVPVDLDRAASSVEGRAVLGEAISSLLAALRGAPETLDGGALNLLGMEGRFTRDLETWRLVELGEAFLALLDGAVNTTAQDADFLPGCAGWRGC